MRSPRGTGQASSRATWWCPLRRGRGTAIVPLDIRVFRPPTSVCSPSWTCRTNVPPPDEGRGLSPGRIGHLATAGVSTVRAISATIEMLQRRLPRPFGERPPGRPRAVAAAEAHVDVRDRCVRGIAKNERRDAPLRPRSAPTEVPGRLQHACRSGALSASPCPSAKPGRRPPSPRSGTRWGYGGRARHRGAAPAPGPGRTAVRRRPR